MYPIFYWFRILFYELRYWFMSWYITYRDISNYVNFSLLVVKFADLSSIKSFVFLLSKLKSGWNGKYTINSWDLKSTCIEEIRLFNSFIIFNFYGSNISCPSIFSTFLMIKISKIFYTYTFNCVYVSICLNFYVSYKPPWVNDYSIKN